MSISLRVLAASAALAFAGSTLAAAPKTEAPPVKHRTAQQQRMADCNKRATGKKGDERKAFMSSLPQEKGRASHALNEATATPRRCMRGAASLSSNAAQNGTRT